MPVEPDRITRWRQLVASSFDHCATVTVEPTEDAEPAPGPEDLSPLLESACSDPIDAPPLQQLLKRANRLVITLPDVDDALHPATLTGLATLLDAELAEAEIDVLLVPTSTDPVVREGDHAAAIRSLQASSRLGRHKVTVRRPDPRGFRPVITERPVRHPVTRRVIPSLVDNALFDADLVLCVHRVRPDVQLGLAGGMAALLLGCASPRTLAEVLHADASAEQAYPAAPMDHPAHRAFRRVGRALPPVFGIAECPGDEAFAYAAGDLCAVLQALGRDRDSPMFRNSASFDGAVLFVDDSEARDVETALLAYLHLVRQAAPPLNDGAPVLLVPSANLPGERNLPPVPPTPHGLAAGARMSRDALLAAAAASSVQHPLHVLHPDPPPLPAGVHVHSTFERAVRFIEMQSVVRDGEDALDLLLTRGVSRMLPVAGIVPDLLQMVSRPG